MKKILLLLTALLVLAACAGPETAVLPEAAVAEPVTETAVAEEPAATDGSTDPVEQEETAVFPATTVAEASIVRDRDWQKGAADPAVTIIEYGDFQ
jgi:hypothetical protein